MEQHDAFISIIRRQLPRGFDGHPTCTAHIEGCVYTMLWIARGQRGGFGCKERNERGKTRKAEKCLRPVRAAENASPPRNVKICKSKSGIWGLVERAAHFQIAPQPAESPYFASFASFACGFVKLSSKRRVSASQSHVANLPPPLPQQSKKHQCACSPVFAKRQ